MKQLAPVEAVPRLRTIVAERIREAIANGTFLPGTRLIERNLCDMLSVSRTSIREGLRELESEGLISTDGGRPIVAVLSPKELDDIYQVRVVLEGLAARLFAQNASNEGLQRLEDAWTELEAVYLDYSPTPFLRAKARFYDVLFEGAGNETAASMLRIIHTKVSQLRALSLSTGSRAQESIKEIGNLLEALKQRDGDLAERLTIEHIKNAAKAASAAHKRIEAIGEPSAEQVEDDRKVAR